MSLSRKLLCQWHGIFKALYILPNCSLQRPSQFASTTLVCEHTHFLMSWIDLQKLLRGPSTGLYLGGIDWNDVQRLIEESQLSGVQT